MILFKIKPLVVFSNANSSKKKRKRGVLDINYVFLTS